MALLNPQLWSSSQFSTHGCAVTCTLNIVPTVCHCVPLYGTFETVALCRGVETKVIIYGNRAETEMDSKCSARLSLRTYFGVSQPLIASFADPKKGKYPVVDAQGGTNTEEADFEAFNFTLPSTSCLKPVSSLRAVLNFIQYWFCILCRPRQINFGPSTPLLSLLSGCSATLVSTFHHFWDSA